MATDDGQGTSVGHEIDPRSSTTVSDLLGHLRTLRTRAGMPTYREIAERIARRRAAQRQGPGPVPSDRPAISTVADYFTRTDRARLDYDLFFELVRALGATSEQTPWWQEAWQHVFAAAPDDEVEAGAELANVSAVFVGRESELRELLAIAPSADPIIISGMAGVGKTALAVHAARALQRRDHPDATLYADLGGFNPTGSPAEPAAVLARFLRVLDSRVPMTSDARIRAYRNALQDRSALIVLDNGADVDQILPLLPPASRATVLITSRTELDVPRARHVRLGVLSSEESVTLLERLTSAERVSAEPAAAYELVQHCARLPLALNLIGQHVRATPGWTLADHAARLLELRLDEGVRSAFAVSYRGLDAADARLFRRLAILPGMDFDVFAAAALDETTRDQAAERLDHLVTAHLVQPQGAAGRLRMHDLVRAYAVERALDDEPASQRSAALARILDHYRHTAATAVDRYVPSERALRPVVPESQTEQPPFDDAAAAFAWLEAELDNLVAGARYAADHGDVGYACDMSAILYRYLIFAGHLDTSVLLHRTAAVASDPGALSRLGSALLRKAQYAEAADCLERSAAIARDASDNRLLLPAVGNLGLVYERQGRYQDALAMQRRAFGLATDDLQRSRALLNMGLVELRLAQLDDAKEHTRMSCDLARRVNDSGGEVTALLNLAQLQRHDKDFAGSLALAEQAQVIAQREGHRIHSIANEIGESLSGLGRLDEAVTWQRRAIDQATENGDRMLQVLALNSYGRVLTRQGLATEAIGRHEDALELAEDQQDPREAWHAHDGLARAYEQLGDRERCRLHQEHAAECLERLGLSEPPL